MNVGDYVRTPNGVIAKIIDIQDEEGQYFVNNNAVSLKSKTYIADKNITIGESFKHSSNIIDLIEVGDYVNGYLVYEIKENCVMVGYKSFKTEFDNEEDFLYQTIYANNIKSIATKEQFERGV